MVALRPDGSIGPYSLSALIGRGGFGEVWSATAPHIAGELAIKVLRNPAYASVGRGPTSVDRFLGEARILKRLDHPGVVRVVDILDLRPEALAYVMERIDGWPLSHIAGRLQATTLLTIFRRVAEALAYVHSQGLLHRDVKASNIIVGRPAEDGTSEVKLIDFGIAKDVSSDDPETSTGMLIGTIRGMAPESIARFSGTTSVLSPAVDQWGLGVTMYRSFTGRPPFDGPNIPAVMRAILGEPPPPMWYRDELDLGLVEGELSALVERMLAKRPQDRLRSMGEVAAQLEAMEALLISGATLVSFSAEALLGGALTLPPGALVGLNGRDVDDGLDPIARSTTEDDEDSLLAAPTMLDRHEEVLAAPTMLDRHEEVLAASTMLDEAPMVRLAAPAHPSRGPAEPSHPSPGPAAPAHPSRGPAEPSHPSTPDFVRLRAPLADWGPGPADWRAPEPDTVRPLGAAALITIPAVPSASAQPAAVSVRAEAPRWWWLLLVLVGVACFFTGRYLAT
ncbi:MAG: protein kinase [Myxococcales bacterium]|nr:protein kinase [Myxococcales bacterium]